MRDNWISHTQSTVCVCVCVCPCVWEMSKWPWLDRIRCFRISTPLSLSFLLQPVPYVSEYSHECICVTIFYFFIL